MWLRERSLAPGAVQASTRQRLFEVTALPGAGEGALGVVDAKSVEGNHGEDVRVKFSDGHLADYSINDLLNEVSGGPDFRNRLPERQLWSGHGRMLSDSQNADLAAQLSFDRSSIESDPAAYRRFLGTLLSHGAALVRGLPAEPGTIESWSSDYLGVVRDTNWGKL